MVYAGQVNHKDSLGNDDTIGAGDVQWMTAGDGIWHEEMLVGHADGNNSVQLWFNMPAAEKADAPSYRAYGAPEIPVVTFDGGSLRVIAGDYLGTAGAIGGIRVAPSVYDIDLKAGGSIAFPIAVTETAMLYVVTGSVEIDGTEIKESHLAVLNENSAFSVRSSEGAKVLYVDAMPLREQVTQYRSFVMNTPAQIGETLAKIADGSFAASAKSA